MGVDMSVAIPSSINDVDAKWLAEATGFDIKTADIGIIGVGVGVASAVYRAKLTGNNCPASVIVKMPALDEAAVFTSSILRMYIREVRFFKSLAKECPVITPRSYFGEINEETSQFAMVLEDLAGHRIIDQTVGISRLRMRDALSTHWRRFMQSGGAKPMDWPLTVRRLRLVIRSIQLYCQLFLPKVGRRSSAS